VPVTHGELPPGLSWVGACVLAGEPDRTREQAFPAYSVVSSIQSTDLVLSSFKAKPEDWTLQCCCCYELC
jgi:hypothetical protein